MIQKKAHPWRSCPLGKYWVSPHSRNRVSSRGLAYVQNVSGYCRSGRSYKDHLYKDEIVELSKKYFSKLKKTTLKSLKAFKEKGNSYDQFILGWTQYWNDILKPSDFLDPNLVKALIASESSFSPKKYNGSKGKNAAYGLMQVTVGTVQLLKNPKEIKDHFVNLSSEDMQDPNLAICAGIRWLFRKKELAEAKYKKKVNWRDVVREYKGYKINDKSQKGMEIFDKYYEELNVK